MEQFIINHLTVTAISDTHGSHRKLNVPQSDVLIHAGDACIGGDEEQLNDFFKWFADLPARYKIFVAGNHDLPFELDPTEAIRLLPIGVVFLEDSAVSIEGVKFYGAVARPWMYSLSMPPADVDVLISHGPAMGTTLVGKDGCVLLKEIVELVKPKIHVFGHMHEYGGLVHTLGETTSICCSSIHMLAAD